MAIKLRRGNYADLNTSRLVEGEPVISLDKISSYGRLENYVAIAVAPSQVVRLATYDAIAQIESSVDMATEAAENAQTSEQNANDYSVLSESWAKGGTDTRSGEDTNNSKYYSDQAQGYEQSTENYYHLIETAMGGTISMPTFSINTSTGNVEAEDVGRFIFDIDTTTGNLTWALTA